ncbi:glycosyltransferase family 1 protein [Emticicia sp. BO119]|uniref:glycosyltransferase family 4 protein n=1 Tax=Emticicia sp. BO119 TaxID=2757768 RepID=UPI0015F10626|nr:glycosyltransferase family 1 protein [Emticicia sp. BO119]MBA4852669.1 glycosyltransferase family 4 protein [Emticicia sp. BO119]
MRIGIEAQRIFRPKKHGMDIVILEILRQLQQIETPHEYYAYAQPYEDTNTLHSTKNVKVKFSGPTSYPVWEQYLLPRETKKDKVDLLHCTSNTAPLNINIPLVVTIHDIIYLEKRVSKNNVLYQRLGNVYRKWNVPKIAKKASMIVTVSNYERTRIIEGLNLPEERVRTVYNACSNHFSNEYSAEELEAFRKRMNLPERFVLMLGNTDPKKNLPNIIRTLGLLHERKQLDFTLVMPDFNREHLHSLIKSQNNEHLMNHIMLTGYIHNQELPKLYKLAQLFLYPSLRESFGIPILEAMQCGTPLITSNTSAMPEIAGDGAILIDPTQIEDIADKIVKVLTDTELRTKAIAYGLERVKLFSWKRTTEQMVGIYNEVLNV